MRACTLTAAALAALTACKGADDGPIYSDDTGDTWVPWPDDTDEPQGTDEDRDGWSVEEGDCDDNNIYVNPARDEDATDGIDNDCDGRIDEVFHGLVVLQQGDGTVPARVVFLDDFGEQVDEVLFDDADLIPFFMTEGLNGGWVIGTLANYDGANEVQVALYEVTADGSTSLLADFSDAEAWAFGMWGIATHPDGYYLVTTGDSLQAVEPGSGVLTPLATWDAEGELYAFDVDVDILSGDIGVTGYYGGFATLTAEGAVSTHRTFDPENIEYLLLSGKHRDVDGWWAGGSDVNGWGVFKFDEDAATWVRRADFEGQDESWNPRFFSTDDVNGGFYVTTTEATYPTVWRIPDDGGTASAFFLSDIRDNDFALWDLYTLY
ncbi:MAG: putative metal-binding motif-containing protein [Alphaproteobacteria bacterium]|nr:putative metal-binding motif-containing protein [Alphaproteobacteria bacterium]